MSELVMSQTVKLQFEIRDCPGCSIKYGVPEGFQADRRKDHKTFFCPNGCQRHYPQDNVEEVLRKKLHAATLDKERAEKQCQEAWTAEQAAMEARIKAERALKRANASTVAGKCPCCRRNFASLSEHIAKQHPEFKSENKP